LPRPSADSLFPPGAAVVIGGTGGIGSAICRRLAQAGSDIAFTYRSNETGAGQLQREIETMGRRVTAGRLALTDPEGVRAFVESAASKFAGIHTVVLATGSDIRMTYVADITDSEWTDTLAADLTGSFYVLKAALPHLRKSGGAIVALTSAGLKRHPPKDILSVVPKAGIEALIRGIAREEGRFGVRANALALGVIDTGLFHRITTQVSPDFIESMKRNTALRRFGTAEEAADAVAFLASRQSAYMTGQSIALDGGFSV
jgi:NAD(P)-dependent dehydrogenase (short-subunit alcohol dehydrogenase family)